MKLALAVLATTLVAAARSDSDGPDSYRARFAITITAGARLQRANVPASVLAQLRTADAADLRVFDAKGRAMPMAVTATPGSTTRLLSVKALPILGAPDAVAVTGLSLRFDDNGRPRLAQVEGSLVKPAAGSSLLGVLFDLRDANGNAEALTLDADVPEGQPVTFRAEATQDLRTWRPLGEMVVYRVPGSKSSPVGERLHLASSPLRDSYVRLTWRAESRLISPVVVRRATLLTRAELADGQPTVEARTPAPVEPRAVEFAVPFATPIVSLAVVPGGGELLIPIRVLGREDREQPWRLLGAGMAGAPDAGSRIRLDRSSPSMMRIEADPRTSGFASAPRVQFGFTPIEITFVATGTPPYELAAGRAGAANNNLPAAMVLAGARERPGKATIVVPGQALVKLEPAGTSGLSKRDVALWAVLITATAVLAAMAWSLWRRRESAGLVG